MEVEKIYWLVRFDHPITWPSGAFTNVVAMVGTFDTVEKNAAEIAEQFGLKVEAIV